MDQKKIGPSFASEVLASPAAGLPFSWDAAGDLLFDPAMTPEQIAAVNAVYAAHDPTKAAPVPIIAYTDFRKRWLDAEKALLFNARQASWQIDDFIDLAAAANLIDLTSAEAISAKAALVTANVLSQARADVVFAI